VTGETDPVPLDSKIKDPCFKRTAGEGEKEDRTERERAGESGLSGANKQYEVTI